MNSTQTLNRAADNIHLAAASVKKLSQVIRVGAMGGADFIQCTFILSFGI